MARPISRAIPSDRTKTILVLSSQHAFEVFAGPVPEAQRSRYVFLKPDRGARIFAALRDARVVLSQTYLRPEVNRWIFAARRLGVPTLLMLDGPLEWSNLHTNPSLAQPGAGVARALYDPIVHDAVATIGEAQSRFIASRNPNRGIAFMSYANQRIRTNAPTAASRSATDAPGPSFDFLLTTARTAAFDARERTDLTKALATCAAALAAAGQRTLVRIFDDEIRQSVQTAAPGAHFDASGSSAFALGQSRCVIGTPSSVLLEAMHHDRPTATLVFRDSPLLYATGWILGGFSDPKTTFASMLARDPDRMALQREALREHLSDADFFEQVEAIVRGDRLAAPRALDALDLEFENQVLRQLVGFRARLFAPLYRALRGLRSKNAPSS